MALLFAKNNSLSAVTALPASVSGGGLNLISTQTASSSATIDFTSGIDSTYKEYIFKFYDVHPATDNADFNFQTSTNGGSSYGVTVTNTYFSAYHNEGGSYTSLAYRGCADLAQCTNFIELGDEIGNENDQCFAATLHLFDPSNTTFIKHYLYRGSHTQGNGDYMVDILAAGYFNTTSALDAIQFKFSSGNIDSGTIKLYGVT